MDTLTRDQMYFARKQFARWLAIRDKHDPRYQDLIKEGRTGQMMADIEHSSLLLRLLSGKEPLDEPPPLTHGYPDYKAVEGE